MIFLCANVSEKRYLNTMTPEHKAAWKCVICIIKIPKKSNTQTPVRGNVNIHRGASVQSHSLHMDSQLDDSSLIAPSSPTLRSQIFIDELRAFREELRTTRLQKSNLTSAITTLTQRVDECELRVD